MRAVIALLAASFLAGTAGAAAPVPAAADSLAATIHTEDVERFARVFAASKGRPTAEQLQRGYLDPGSYGVSVLTADRIEDARGAPAPIG